MNLLFIENGSANPNPRKHSSPPRRRPWLSAPRFERRRRTCALGWRLRCGRGIVRFHGTGFQGLDFGFEGMGFLENRFMEGIEVVGEGCEKLGRGGEITFCASRSSKNFWTRFVVTSTSVPIGRYGDETTLF
ncbi:hypothetical protein EV1_013176 [Malus domestica]